MEGNLFVQTISDWNSWADIFQSIAAFTPLARFIYEREGIPFSPMEHLTEGTNAVFKVGQTVLKIFAPEESGVNDNMDHDTELFGIRRANGLGIGSPKLLAHGCVQDSYAFQYLILQYIEAPSLEAVSGGLTAGEKEAFARNLRKTTDTMNTACEEMQSVDVLERALANPRWKRFPVSFQTERLAYLQTCQWPNAVYVHGDLNPGNVLVEAGLNPCIIDFADALRAPIAYEWATVVCELFRFDFAYMNGYFGANWDADEMAALCLYGLLMHADGCYIITDRFGDIGAFTGLSVLQKRLRATLVSGL